MSLGPLTTTFSPPADCVASSALYWVNTASTFYWLHGQPGQSSCFPDNYSPYQNQYYSPGICPSGYTRACEEEATSTGAATKATCCPQGNYVCAATSSSYSYPWGPTLGCMSVYLVNTETSFTTIDGTLAGGETAGEVKSLEAPGTIMAYGIVIQNTPAATTTTTDEAAAATATDSSSSDSSIASETASSTAAGDGSNSSSGSGGGLSSGAAAGIGIGTAVGVLALGGAILWMFWSRRRKRRAESAAVAAGTGAGAGAGVAEEQGQGGMMDASSWNSTPWSSNTPYSQQQQQPQQQPQQQQQHQSQYPMYPPTWQASELGNEWQPTEMSADGAPIEKDGKILHWRH
ncbi:hypothetical protein M426DRAFT_321155 [Hypoxylon sp. CI-4A]|nr:hypothetical protein M426DRAFT_321155 [Hypoxylon sp. CI-4A]